MPRDEELHIAGLVVYTTPRRVARVSAAVGLTAAQVHAQSPDGKIVVTLEAASAGAMSAAIGAIQRIDGVLSTALVYQCADELRAMNEELPDAQA
jgi:nitrate reductase NapD